MYFLPTILPCSGRYSGQRVHKSVQISIATWYISPRFNNSSSHYCLVSLMWMKIGSNDITAQVPGVSYKLFSLVGTPKITRGSATRENNFFRLSSYCTVIPHDCWPSLLVMKLQNLPAGAERVVLKIRKKKRNNEAMQKLANDTYLQKKQKCYYNNTRASCTATLRVFTFHKKN
jgi:hypothetical protein